MTLIVIPVIYTLFSDLSERFKRGKGVSTRKVAATLMALLVAAPALSEPSAPRALDLAACVQTALDNNFDIRKARERVELESGALVTARSRRLPKLSLQGNVEQVQPSRVQKFGNFAGSDTSWNIGIELAQNLYAGGGNQAAVRSQTSQREAAVSDLAVMIQDVVLQVRARFYAVLLAEAEIEVQTQNLKLLEEELQSAKHKLDAGAVAPFAVLRAEVGLANGQTPLIRARNNYKLALEELRRVLGVQETIEVNGTLDPTPLQLPLEQAVAEAEANRIELRKLQHLLEARSEDVNGANAGHLPRLDGYAGYGAVNDRMSDSPSDELHGWAAGLRLNWSIWDSSATRGQVAQAASRKALAQLELEQTRQVIDVEVRRAHSSLAEAEQLLKATDKVVEQAEEGLRLIKSRFDVGAATQLDVLDSRVALLSARQNRDLARHDHQLAAAKLERALGRGVQTSEIR